MVWFGDFCSFYLETLSRFLRLDGIIEMFDQGQIGALAGPLEDIHRVCPTPPLHCLGCEPMAVLKNKTFCLSLHLLILLCLAYLLFCSLSQMCLNTVLSLSSSCSSSDLKLLDLIQTGICFSKSCSIKCIFFIFVINLQRLQCNKMWRKKHEYFLEYTVYKYIKSKGIFNAFDL